MNNKVLMLCRNNLELTKRAVASIAFQDIPTDLLLLDNDSTDGTLNWAQEQNFHVCAFRPQLGVSAGWNWGLQYLFAGEAPHVLVVNNDVVLPPWYYRCLLSYYLPLVSGYAVESWKEYQKANEPYAPAFSLHPDFSAFLITRMCWEWVGKFDERMFLYASDCDYSVRAFQAGLEARCVPELIYYHERSSTLNNADPQQQIAIRLQADADREVFKSLHGCMPWERQYEELFKCSLQK